MSVGRCNDFDDIAILQFCSQRNDTVVDLDRSGMVTDIRMDIVGKIQRGCGPGQSDDFGLRGENIYGVLEKIDFDMFDEFGGIAGLLLNVQQGLEPAQTVFLKIGQGFVSCLVQPMGGDACFGDMMHILRSDQEINRIAVRTDYGGMQ